MDFSCHTWAFNDLTLPEAFGTIARLGFRYVDIGSGPHLNTANAAQKPRDTAAEIKHDLKEFNLQVADLYLMLPRLSSPDEDTRRKTIDLFKALVPFARELGTPGITVSPGAAQPAEDKEAHNRTVAALREIVKACQDTSLAISIEPHMDSMAQKPEAALRFIKDVSGLQITLDWSQMVCQNISHDKIVKLLPHVRHVQLRQAARAQLQTPFDRGRIDLSRVLEALQKADYKGLICVEYMNTPGWHGMIAVNAIRESARMRDELRKLRDQSAKKD